MNSRALGFVQLNGSTIRYDKFVEKLWKKEDFKGMVLHATVGLIGEVGELTDIVKKHVIYTSVEPSLDTASPKMYLNLVEELGDLRFFLQAMMNLYGIGEQEILQTNANKLAMRYENMEFKVEEAHERKDKIEEEIPVITSSPTSHGTLTTTGGGGS